ncbi:MAG TPA: hypothetical protein VJ841_05385 [Candidatus Saccharimonadales bacterium]|nr:hypothetical protein [Candidatus Saccharimonadales bacterium]
MRNFKRKTIGAVAAVLMSIGIGTAVASPASANSYGDYAEVYTADLNGACQLQGHSRASYTDFWNPYSGFCIDDSFSLGTGASFNVGSAGSIDVNGWCQNRYGGAFVARVLDLPFWNGDPFGRQSIVQWYCVR